MTKTILVADDNPEIRDLVDLILQDNGHLVIKAKNGHEALETYKY